MMLSEKPPASRFQTGDGCLSEVQIIPSISRLRKFSGAQLCVVRLGGDVQGNRGGLRSAKAARPSATSFPMMRATEALTSSARPSSSASSVPSRADASSRTDLSDFARPASCSRPSLRDEVCRHRPRNWRGRTIVRPPHRASARRTSGRARGARLSRAPSADCRPSRHKSPLGMLVAYPCGTRGKHHVGAEHKFGAAGETQALHRGDDRQRTSFKAIERGDASEHERFQCSLSDMLVLTSWRSAPVQKCCLSRGEDRPYRAVGFASGAGLIDFQPCGL